MVAGENKIKSLETKFAKEERKETEKFQKNKDELKKNLEILNTIKDKLVDPNLKTDFFSFINTLNLVNGMKENKDKEESSAEKSRSKGGNEERAYKNMKDFLEDDSNVGFLSQLLYNEMGRIRSYHNYNLIYKLIPQMKEVVDTYVENIFSPNNFTKESLGYKINVEDQDNEKDYRQKLEEIEKIYKLEIKIKKYVEDALKLGDCFVSVLPFGEEISNLLQETWEKEKEDVAINALSESNLLSEEKLLKEGLTLITEDSELSEGFDLFYEDVNAQLKENKIEITKKEDAKKIFIKSVNNFINESFDVSYDCFSLLKEDLSNREAFIKDNDINKYLNIVQGTDKNKKVDKDKEKDLELNGSIIRVLPQDRVVKIAIGKNCIGYFLIEAYDLEGYSKFARTGAIGYDIYNFFQTSIEPRAGGLFRNKDELVYNIITRQFLNKINKKFISNNPHFKEIIYAMLRQHDLFKRFQMKATFLPEKYVVQFTPNAIEENEYGTSIYENSIFMAKIYLATLVSTLMMKLTRSADKRAFYVEVGVEGEQEAAVASFVNDIKGKDIKMAGLDDINYILNNVGRFEDMYVPVFNGQKPVDMEIVPGQDADVNDEFLTFLKNSIVAGCGIPPTFIEQTEQVDFVKTLSMLNGKFSKKIIMIQGILKESFNKLVRLLFENEYLVNTKNVSEAKLNPELIEATLPPPDSIFTSQMSEDFTSADSYAEGILNIMINDSDATEYGSDNEKEMVRSAFKKRLLKERVTTIDWNKMEEMLEDVKTEVIAKIASGDRDPEDVEMTGGGGMTGTGDGMMGGGDEFGMGGGDEFGMGEETPEGGEEAGGETDMENMKF
jgi:hypothetical protein